MADESYIRGLTSAIKDRIEIANASTRRENREAEIRRSEAPRVWVNLKLWLAQAVGQVNKEFGSQMPLTYREDLDEVGLRFRVGSNAADLTIHFNDLLGTITAKGDHFSMSFTPAVDGNKLYYVVDSGMNQPVTIEEIGQRIISAVVKP